MGTRPTSFRFRRSYEESVTLKDGRQVLLRLLRPDDKDKLLDGLARLSPESRYSRFMEARSTLSARQLQYLCEVDGVDHFAIGAAAVGPDGAEQGVATARFIRLQDEPTVAEPALTVLDQYQGQGLGRVLLERLGVAARERGIARFHCELLHSNERTRSLLTSFGQVRSVVEHPDAVVMDLEIPPTGWAERMSRTLRRMEAYRSLERARSRRPPSSSSSPRP